MAKQKLLLDRYRVVRAVGTGGFATVYEALDTHLNRPVAIKVFELSEGDVAGFHLAALDGKIAAELDQPQQNDGPAGSGEGGKPAFPSDPSFLTAREERLAARNGASLRKKPNFQELAQAFEDELASEGSSAAAAGFNGASALAGASGAGQAGAPNPATASPDDDTVPWDEEDLGPDEYFDSLVNYEHSEAQQQAAAEVAPFRLQIIGAAAEAQRAAEEGVDGSGNAAGEGSSEAPTESPAAHSPASGATPNGSAASAEAAPAPEADDDGDDGETESAFDRIPAIIEARLIASLNDPNIVTVYDCQESDGRAYIIMEFVDGLTLDAFMEKAGDDITLDMVAAVVAGVTGALEAAHSHNVLHLDIKPENVLIDRQGSVKVTDFGLATLADASGHGHAAAGTIGYMPPEQLRQQDLDVRTDEWAAASLTYELLTGSNQFIVEDLEKALPAIEDSELPVPSQMWDDAGPDLDDVLFAGLDIDPEDRYPTVEEFAQALLPQLGSARKGKKQLAAVVNEEETEPAAAEEPPVPQGPVIPLVDKVGPRGAQLLVRILSALCCGLCAALAMMNFHALGTSTVGLAADAPVVFWPLLIAAVAVTAVRPTFGALIGPLFLTISFFANEAFLLALGFGVITVAWWVKFCRDDEPMALCALLEPAVGSFGMGAAAPLLAGGLLSVGRAAICAAYNAVFALALACLGSCTLLGWNIAANSSFTINMQSVFVNIIQRPETWIIGLSWVVAAVLFSLLCARGTRFFDVLGSLAGAAVIIAAGWLAAGVSYGFDPLAIAGCILPGLFAVVLALLGVPDRARRDVDDWEALRDPESY